MAPARGERRPGEEPAGRHPGPERAAGWLLRCYPRSWRARYGEEFAALLAAEFAAGRRPYRITADVILAGLLARMRSAGLTSHGLDPAEQIRASLATLGCALAVFLAFGAALWAQLMTSWQWSVPASASARAALAAMSVAAAVLAALALLGVVPLAWTALAALARGRSGKLARPAALLALGAVVLIGGGHHFENAWPGTGGTAAAAHPGLVPGGVAAFSWASTLSVSSYWGHLQALRAFPAAEITWMAVSPLAWFCLAAGGAGLVRRLRPSARLLAFAARVAAAAVTAMMVFAVGAAGWIFGTGSAAGGLFHAGIVDVAGLAVMTLCLLAAGRAAVTAHRARLALGAPAR
ncbi:MAG: hypothetical protein ACLP52_27260 [Streptosporangiaceae bacterium]